MKNYFVVLFVFVSVAAVAQSKKSILFIGNSYTAVNNLPQLVHDVALSTNDTLLFDSSAPGSQTLQLHCANATTISKINQQQWDMVVLQEQSQLPSFSPGQVQTDVFPYAKRLDSLIRANDSCTKTIFYMTWGRKYGDASNCASYPPVCTYAGMQQRLRESYLELADSNEAWVSPVGAAWRNSRIADSTINLYQADYSHPTAEGSYLAACVFYALIYKKSPVGVSFISTLAPLTAAFLQNIAKLTVIDSLTNWKVNKWEPHAHFAYLVNDSMVTTTNQTTGSGTFSYSWNWGDGNFSNGANATHNYADTGTYTVQQIATWRCIADTFTQQVKILKGGGVNGITQLTNNKEQLIIYPNPVGNKLIVNGYSLIGNTIQIYDVLGRMCCHSERSEESKSKAINVAYLPNGVYFIKVSDEKGNVRMGKFVKE